MTFNNLARNRTRKNHCDPKYKSCSGEISPSARAAVQKSLPQSHRVFLWFTKSRSAEGLFYLFTTLFKAYPRPGSPPIISEKKSYVALFLRKRPAKAIGQSYRYFYQVITLGIEYKKSLPTNPPNAPPIPTIHSSSSDLGPCGSFGD